MKIAFFADSYKPYISGVTNSIELLSKELKALGHTVYIFCPSYPGAKEKKEEGIFRFPSIPSPYPRFRIALPFVKDFPDVDIIHSHTPFQTGLVARHLARKKQKPFVYTFHTLFTRYIHYMNLLPEKASKIAVSSYIKEFSKNADMIIAPTKMSKRALRIWGVSSPCEVVPSGIDLEEISSIAKSYTKKEVRSSLAIPENAEVLVYMGRISKEKNIGFIVDCFNKIKNENRFLVLIGGGPLLPEFENIKNVLCVGELSHKEALKTLLCGDLFVFSSLSETQGLVLSEAKALGLPIVALFAGGIVDSVRSGMDGLLSQRNSSSFCSKIEVLLNSPDERKKMSELSIADAKERFDSKKIAKDMERIYNSLINRPEAI